MSETYTDTDTDADKTRIETIGPEHEPEYVGAFSEPVREQCGEWIGEFVEDLEPCENEATHTVVMRDSNDELVEIPMCDDCGEPDDVEENVVGEPPYGATD